MASATFPEQEKSDILVLRRKRIFNIIMAFEELVQTARKLSKPFMF